MSQPFFPAPQVTVLLLAVYTAAAALVGVWAATSKRHWFWRALSVWACVAVLLPVRVYEPAMVLGVGLPLLVATVAGARFWRRASADFRTRLRFGLADLLLLTALTALAIVVVTVLAERGPRVTAVDILAPGVVVAMLGAVTTWIVKGPRRLLATALLVCAVLVAALLVWPRVEWIYSIDALEIRHYTRMSSQTYWAGFRSTLFGMAAFSAALLPGCLLLLARPAKVSRVRLLLAGRCLVGASLLGVGAWLYGQLWKQREFPPSLDSAENRAERIFEIGRQLQQLNPQFVALRQGGAVSFDEQREQDLRRLYGELLELLEASNCIMLPEPSEIRREHQGDSALRQAQVARHILQCLEAEWKAATAEGEVSRELELALAGVRVGAMHRRNSTVSQFLIGGAVIGVPTAYFVKQRETYDRTQAARIIGA